MLGEVRISASSILHPPAAAATVTVEPAVMAWKLIWGWLGWIIIQLIPVIVLAVFASTILPSVSHTSFPSSSRPQARPEFAQDLPDGVVEAAV